MLRLRSLFIAVFHLYLLKYGFCEEFNLYGEAGQAYALQINVGHPPQKLHVLVDTGSATLAVAAYPRKESNVYFHYQNSTTLYKSGKEVQAKYSQGTWSGQLASDVISFPSLKTVPEVRSDLALITKSHKFFMNGSGWQGLLGLAYLPVAAWGDNAIVGSWLDFAEEALQKPMSFELKLCGTQSLVNATHFGNLRVFDDTNVTDTFVYRTPILRKRWYEIGVLSIRLFNSSNNTKNDINIDTCRKLNVEKSIVDSGTTSIRMPDSIFRQVVDELRNSAQVSNMLILDEFWYHGEAACWPEPQEWNLPSIAIDILSMEADNQYFTLEIPAQNFMRVITARNNTAASGTVSEFCYDLGLESGGTETVLGYTAMEGLQVLFNRSSGWIGFKESNCGPNAHVFGPFNTTNSLLYSCQLTQNLPVDISINAAQYTLAVISVIGAGIIIYLLAPCIKTFFVKPLPMAQQISLSQAALVEQDT